VAPSVADLLMLSTRAFLSGLVLLAVVATGSATRAQDLFWGRVYDVAESPKSIGALQIDDDGAAELFVGHDAFQGFTTLHSLGDGTYAVGSPSAAAPYT